MSKYLCQTCKSNNNGWCTVRKCNGLKKMNIMSCNTYESKIADEDKVENYEEKTDNSQSYRILGKREMLWHIQMQILGINEDNNLSNEDKYNELVECIKSFGTHLEFEEQLWKVDDIIDSIIDEDMIKNSKLINNNL